MTNVVHIGQFRAVAAALRSRHQSEADVAFVLRGRAHGGQPHDLGSAKLNLQAITSANISANSHR